MRSAPEDIKQEIAFLIRESQWPDYGYGIAETKIREDGLIEFIVGGRRFLILVKEDEKWKK